MQAPKNGFFYVLDAKTGEFISASPFTDDQLGHARRHGDRPARRDAASALLYDTGKPYTSLHPPNGAHTWHSMSFSPLTGLVYIPIHMQNFIFNDEPCFTPSGLAYNTGIRRAVLSAADPAVRKRRRRRR